MYLLGDVQFIQHQAITLRLCAFTTLFYTLLVMNTNISHLTEKWLTTMLYITITYQLCTESLEYFTVKDFVLWVWSKVNVINVYIALCAQCSPQHLHRKGCINVPLEILNQIIVQLNLQHGSRHITRL